MPRRERAESASAIGAMSDFIGVLAGMKNGRTAIHLSRRLSEVVQAVHQHRQKGSLVCTLVVTPLNEDATEVSLEVKVKTTCPDPGPGAAVLFVSQDGRLTQDDPDHDSFEGDN